METLDAVIEAEVELDSVALAQEQERRRSRKGEQAARIAVGGLPATSTPEENAEEREGIYADEESPLLSNEHEDGDDSSGERRSSWQGNLDFEHLPWYRRPSIFWVIWPYFIMACAFGGILAPKLNLTTELICREYLSERMAQDPGFTMMPVDFNNGDNDQCRIPEVQSRVATFTLIGGLISGVLAAVVSPKLGALSDRYGRKPLLIITSFGTILAEVVTICAAVYAETFPVQWLLLNYALDGATGTFIVTLSISNAYATDCTQPSRRNVAFGYFHASLFTGLAIGPILAGYLIKWTGQIVTVFYVMICVHISFVLFVAIFVPESLSKKRQLLAREKHEHSMSQKSVNRDWVNQLRALNLLEPLKILRPTGPGTSRALRRNLWVLAAIDTIVFGVSMGSMTVIVIYQQFEFGWKSFESGRYMTIVNSCRVFGLIIVLPLLTRLVKGKPESRKRGNAGCDYFDLIMLRVAVFFDTLGYLGFTLARTGGLFTLAGVVASIGSVGSPTLQAALTKHIPADRTGQVLGAIGLLHVFARVAAPAVFNAIYAATVWSFRQTVFLCLCATFALAFLLTWFVRPHVFYDEDAAVDADADAAREGHSNAPDSALDDHR